MKLMKSIVASAAKASMLVSFAVTPVSASSQDQVTDEALTNMQEASPYVEAETEEEALKKLDQLEKDNSGGMSAQAASARFGPCKL